MTGYRPASAVASTVALLLAGCQSAPIDNVWALRAAAIEATVDDGGNVTAVEYHIAPNLVPMAVRGGMSELYPAATFTAAEHEVEGGAVYYELTAEVDGRAVEGMFHEDGRLHSLEVEVDPGSEPAITRAVLRLWPGSSLKSLEEIRDGERLLVEYHVKIEADGKALKVRVDRDGKVIGAVREISAEFEVPTALPKL
ncbi:MAG: hypothetical protein KDE27_08090 [Planctomycetes bacterium]|nr:hypothetical protein [Planctomycetota bacterium]